MAAAAIPLVLTGIQLLAPLIPQIPGIIKQVEELFGPGTGPQKATAATQLATAAAQSLATSGKIQGTPDPAAVASIVEVVFQQLRASGQLAPAAAPTAGKRVLIVGTLQEIA